MLSLWRGCSLARYLGLGLTGRVWGGGVELRFVSWFGGAEFAVKQRAWRLACGCGIVGDCAVGDDSCHDVDDDDMIARMLLMMVADAADCALDDDNDDHDDHDDDDDAGDCDAMVVPSNVSLILLLLVMVLKVKKMMVVTMAMSLTTTTHHQMIKLIAFEDAVG